MGAHASGPASLTHVSIRVENPITQELLEHVVQHGALLEAEEVVAQHVTQPLCRQYLHEGRGGEREGPLHQRRQGQRLERRAVAALLHQRVHLRLTMVRQLLGDHVVAPLAELEEIALST